MSVKTGDAHSNRAETISRLALEYLYELIERDLQHLGSDADIDTLEVPDVLVSFDAMGDEAIARAGAEAMFKALLEAM